MNSSQVLIAKRILQTLIKNIHLEDPEKKDPEGEEVFV